MLETRYVRRADFVMLACVIALIAIGCLMIYSCTRIEEAKAGRPPTHILRTQLTWVLLGLIALLAMMSTDYTRICSFHLPIYAGTLLLLVFVLFMPSVKGAHRWIVAGPVRFQPAELAQLSVIIVLAALTGAQERVRDFLAMAKTFVWVIPVVGLIVKEPDLGTPIVMFVVWGALMFLSGCRVLHLAGYASAGGMLFTAAWFSGLISERQKERIWVFLNPWADPMGDGYQLRQSLIAIGHGRLFGQGLFHGPQTQLGYIPDQHTDFIFTAAAEELGFLGAVLVLALFAVLLWRFTVAMAEAKDPTGRLLVGGVAAMVGMHILVNIGMTMGLGPVKGMPLPLVSYGGSNLLTTMAAIGLVQSVYMRRHKIAF